MPARVKVKPEGPVRRIAGGHSVCSQGYSATCTSCGALSLTGFVVSHRAFTLLSAMEQARIHLRRFHP